MNGMNVRETYTERLSDADLREQRSSFRRDRQPHEGGKYRWIFQSAPVAMWEEDLSVLLEALERLNVRGTVHLRAYLDDHPDFVREAAQMISVIDANEETRKMYRAQSIDDLLGPRARLLIPQSIDAFKEEIIAIAERKTLVEMEAITATFDGETINVHVRVAIPSDLQTRTHTLVTVMDITELKQAEEALRKSEERFRTIFESAQDCIQIKDVNLRLTDVNPAMEKLLGRSASELIGLTAEDIYGDEAGTHVTEVDLRVLDGEVIEEEHTRPINGVMRTFHDIGVPLRNDEGAIIGLCRISRDITERKRAVPSRAFSRYEYPSSAMRSTLLKARQVAPTESLVMLQGESGSGKDFLARYVHAHSRRHNGPFFEINCAALSHELVESELFGYEPGAFTGARGRKRGMVELAEGGTLLLNEIGELPLDMQAKLLTFLDSKSFLRVGGEKRVFVNIRLIAASHRDLRDEVCQGRFLKALYYRLNVFCIRVPSLRERLEDIPILVGELMERLAADMHVSRIPRFGPAHMEALARRNWPGNVRELRNVLERALIMWDSGHWEPDFEYEEPDVDGTPWKASLFSDLNVQRRREELTEVLCKEALKRSSGNKKLAAQLLGVSRFSFYRYLKATENGEEVSEI